MEANGGLIAFGFVAIVLVILGLGLFSLTASDEFRRKNSNRLMQLRVLMQLIAVGVVLIIVALR